MESSHVGDLGPAVAMVIGPDALVPCLPAGIEPDGVVHLRPDREERDVMVLNESIPGGVGVPSAAERLLWLDGRAGAPIVMASGRSDNHREAAVIKMSSSAISMTDPLQPLDPESLARLLGSSLKTIHELPVADCPYDSELGEWRDRAARRVKAGSISTAHDGPYARVEPAHLLEVLDELIASVGPTNEPVVIHSSPIPAHTWLVPDGSMAFTGWQHCGIGDRHHDLAVAAAALSERYGPALVPPLLEQYGFDLVEPRRLDLHQLLVYLVGMAQ